MKLVSITGSFCWRVAAFTLLLSLASPPPGHAQTAESLNHIKKIFVTASDGKTDATNIQQRLIDSLRKDHSLEVVTNQNQADAILRARGEIWIRGNISVNPRSNSGSYPVYGGFLTAQLIGKDQETLWSYLVTPTKYTASGIREDLADQLVRHLLTALRNAAPAALATLPAQGPHRILKAAGATFPAPLYQAWIQSFHLHHPDIQITYNGIGSEAGMQQLRDRKITIAASDVPLTDAQQAEMPGKIFQFATVVGAVVPVYHLPEAGRDLRFTPEILAGIYLGKIRKWNDPAIKSANHSVTLPNADIIVIHRGDGSGTTFAWTTFLSRTNPTWKLAVGSGSTVNWPIGQPAQGNEGVASAVDRTPNSIGYTELSYAIQRELSYGTVRNAAGNFIQANLISLAAASSSQAPDATNSPLINAPGKEAYPVTSLTWLLVPESIPDPATKSAVAQFLEWILTSGQNECSALAYTPLPKEIVTRELQLLATFKAK